MEKSTTKQSFSLETIKVSNLPELQGWKEKQQAIVKANPFIAIKDNKTYEIAKKRRTALVSARTTITDQDKIIASKLKELRKEAGTLSEELVSITLPHEEEQQTEVKRYEAEKAAEKAAAEKAEQDRIDLAKNKINTFYSTWKQVISELKPTEVESQTKELGLQLKESEKWDLNEFQPEFNEKVVLLREQYKERVALLKVQEENRIAAAKLAKEKKDFEAKKAKDEADRIAKVKEEAKKQKEITDKKVAGFVERLKADGYKEVYKGEFQKGGYSITAEKLELTSVTEFAINLDTIEDNIKKDAELEELRAAKVKADNEKKIKEDKEKADLKAKKDAEAKKQAAIDSEIKAKAEAKRLKDLAPDIEKAEIFIKSLNFSEYPPLVKDKIITELIQDYLTESEALTNNYLKALSKIN